MDLVSIVFVLLVLGVMPYMLFCMLPCMLPYMLPSSKRSSVSRIQSSIQC